MIVYHVAVTTVDDYPTRREPHRRAHIERLAGLRQAGVLIAGGPAPNGKTVDLFYRVQQPEQLERLVEEDPYRLGGAWTAWTQRSFTNFVEPWQQPPIVLDGSRAVTIVEGPVTDPAMGEFVLIDLRGSGRMAFGGFFEGGQTLALATTPDADTALGWFRDSGFWKPDALTARTFLYVL